MTLGGGSWAYGGISFNQLGVINTAVITGLTNAPEVRGNNVEYAGMPGERFMPKVYKGRRLALDLLVQPDPTSYPAMFGTLDSLAKVFAITSQEQSLVHTHPDGTTRTAQASVVQWNPEGEPKGTAVLYRGVVDFYLSDPFFYLPSVLSVQTLSSSPFDFSFTHPGTVRGHKALITFVGPITNPRLTNQTNGVWVQYTGSITSGHSLIIDSEAWTCTNEAGGNLIAGLSHSGAFPFMWMEPGANSLRVTRSAGSGMLNLTLKPPCL